jgi:hypothetical protein
MRGLVEGCAHGQCEWCGMYYAFSEGFAFRRPQPIVYRPLAANLILVLETSEKFQ